VVTVWLVALLLDAPMSPAGHPMHTSVAELRQELPAGTISIAIRMFPDDLATVVPAAGDPAADSALASYVRQRFTLSDGRGRRVGLEYEGIERAGDVLVLRLGTRLGVDLTGAYVSHALLCDRFPDQVNVLRAAYAGGTATLLFLPGDPPKRLP
jgi:hypothetical protein